MKRLNSRHALRALLLLATFGILGGCAAPRETHQTLATPTVKSYNTQYNGVKTTLVVASIENRSNYLQGLFSNGQDQLGSQAKTVLKTHLQQTNRFKLVDRDSMAELAQESGFNGKSQNIKGARYVVSGSVSEFGRKSVSDHQLFGIIGRGKQQIAYAKVLLNIVDVRTSEIIYSSQGAGEYALSSREVVGFGNKMGYDATLNGKVLNLAITEAVNQLVDALESGALKPEV